jgi:hypothetical protein
MRSTASLLVIVFARAALAQPAPANKELKDQMAAGVQLLQDHRYASALAVFNDLYEKYPSAKILLNIGTTLKLLDRKADAANAYQHYLDSPDADAARRQEVGDALAELDASLGKVALTVTPADAEVQVGDRWVPATAAKLVRVNSGKTKLHARRDGYQPLEKEIEVAGGSQIAAALELVAVPKPDVKPVIVTVHDRVEAVPEGPRSRYGAFAMAHVSVVPKFGSAWLIGATADVMPRLAVDAALMLGPGLVSSNMSSYPAPPPKYGAYLGASYAFSDHQLRPRASAGLPVFASNGARFSVRAAAGLEYLASRHLSVLLELGLEEELNPESDIRHLAIVPALAASGRL